MTCPARRNRCAANINLFLQGLRTFLRVTAQHKPAAIRERLAAVEERLATLIPLAQQWVDVGGSSVRLFSTFFRWANQSRVSFSQSLSPSVVSALECLNRPILEQFVISYTLALRWSAYPHGCAQPSTVLVDRSLMDSTHKASRVNSARSAPEKLFLIGAFPLAVGTTIVRPSRPCQNLSQSNSRKGTTRGRRPISKLTCCFRPAFSA